MTLPCRLVREHPGCRSHMDSFFDLGRTRWTNQEGSDDRQHTCPMRSEVNSSPSSSKAAGNGRHCAHRATVIHSIDPSKLGCVPSLGRATHVGHVRPSNEALLRARSGSTKPTWVAFQSFYRGGSTSTEIKTVASLSPSPPSFPFKVKSGELRTGSCVGSTADVERAHSHRARSGSKEPT